jgi:CO/xanthine dehydrogenase FAD-binding subunit
MMRDFEYFAPKTLEEALSLLDKYRETCKVIAGGQSLLKLMRAGLITPQYLIDIKGMSELDYIKSEEKNGVERKVKGI